MDDRRSNAKLEAQGADQQSPAKRRYQSPVLTEYGSVEHLVDSGVVGSVPSIVAV